jgi:predicted Rossmann fold nucleotide-binding protein DprA/Smf involved in DNA uptake
MAGGTIAVVAGGVDVVYPPDNAALIAEIAEKGLILAEQRPGVEPQTRHFPRRNRVISGLAAGTLVVEGAPKSGSLITAQIAAEAGREVMAIPGSPLDPRTQGCNLLIREGATLVQAVADVVEALSAFGQVHNSGCASRRPNRRPSTTNRHRMPAMANARRWRRCYPPPRSPSTNWFACRACRRRWWQRCCSTSN